MPRLVKYYLTIGVYRPVNPSPKGAAGVPFLAGYTGSADVENRIYELLLNAVLFVSNVPKLLFDPTPPIKNILPEVTSAFEDLSAIFHDDKSPTQLLPINEFLISNVIIICTRSALKSRHN